MSAGIAAMNTVSGVLQGSAGSNSGCAPLLGVEEDSDVVVVEGACQREQVCDGLSGLRVGRPTGQHRPRAYARHEKSRRGRSKKKEKKPKP